MAIITPFMFVRHVRGEPTSQILFWKDGKLKRSGRGLSFWFYPLGASLAEVPLDDRELPFLFHARSADFQDVAVQGTILYRVASPDVLAERVDFGLDTRTGAHARQPLDKIALVLTELAREHAAGWVARAALGRVLEEGMDRIRDLLAEGLARDPGLGAMGLEIVAARVSSVKPTPEMEKALMTPAREAVQQRADEATFARRALAVDKERAIQENELANKIELARREQQLIEQHGQNERRRAAEVAEARRIGFESAAAEARARSAAEAEGIRVIEDARVAGERERMAIYEKLPPTALFGLAARDLAANLPTIEHLTLSPDLLSSMLARLAHAGAARLEAPGAEASP
jgi:regulator of protease activity HflC (stomatin/prohibitin superfamily)